MADSQMLFGKPIVLKTIMPDPPIKVYFGDMREAVEQMVERKLNEQQFVDGNGEPLNFTINVAIKDEGDVLVPPEIIDQPVDICEDQQIVPSNSPRAGHLLDPN